MSCTCIEVVNAELAPLNTQILLPMFGKNRKPFVETAKLDEKKRVKPVRMIASYCPFCGVKYGDEAQP